MSREDPQLKIRLPTELKDKITTSASKFGRSINAEVVSRLELSFDSELAHNLARNAYDYSDPLLRLYFYGLELNKIDVKLATFRLLIREVSEKDLELKEKFEFLLNFTKQEKTEIQNELEELLKSNTTEYEALSNQNSFLETLTELAQDLARS